MSRMVIDPWGNAHPIDRVWTVCTTDHRGCDLFAVRSWDGQTAHSLLNAEGEELALTLEYARCLIADIVCPDFRPFIIARSWPHYGAALKATQDLLDASASEGAD